METSRQDSPAGRERTTTGGSWRLGLLFGSISFLLGLNEPTEGLMSQPLASMLKSWGRGASEIATVSALVGIPWSIKPLYGLLSDFLPIGGSRRKSYLIATSALSVVALFGLFAFPVPNGARGLLVAWLMVHSTAVAFSDVVADGLMVDLGQPRGLTGKLQAIQWGALYASGLVIGPVGGFLCERHHETWAFGICGLGAVAILGISAFGVHERTEVGFPVARKTAVGILKQALRSRRLLGVAIFLFLWNFNPFSNVVLYVHMTRELRLSERFYGGTVALTALASIAASVGYGYYCRRVPMFVLAQLSIALGVVSTLSYAAVSDETSAVIVTVAVGITHMTATLIQLDLAAQACPPEAAGTVFALLMALENLGGSLGIVIGGAGYEAGAERWGARASFQVLLAVGSATTACCWLLLPILPRGAFDSGVISSARGEDDSGLE